MQLKLQNKANDCIGMVINVCKPDMQLKLQNKANDCIGMVINVCKPDMQVCMYVHKREAPASQMSCFLNTSSLSYLC
jgi:hypothetical protein